VGSEESVTLPDGSSMHVLEAVQDVAPFIPGKTGPAARVDIHPANGGQPVTLLSYANHPEANRAEAAKAGVPVLTYQGGSERPYTGLQVNKDPGVWVVWAGCLLLCLALYVAFFLPHQRVWLRIDRHQLTITGHTTRGQEPFRRWFDTLTDQLRTSTTQEETK
jgi:cytochrome c biogenesis protein